MRRVHRGRQPGARNKADFVPIQRSGKRKPKRQKKGPLGHASAKTRRAATFGGA